MQDGILFCVGKIRNVILFPWICGINFNMLQGVGCWLIGFVIFFSSSTLSHPQIKTFNTM
jgi:hypothetical protein